jgi:hypothetical protein
MKPYSFETWIGKYTPEDYSLIDLQEAKVGELSLRIVDYHFNYIRLHKKLEELGYVDGQS